MHYPNQLDELTVSDLVRFQRLPPRTAQRRLRHLRDLYARRPTWRDFADHLDIGWPELLALVLPPRTQATA